jgi:hypothetical protein
VPGLPGFFTPAHDRPPANFNELRTIQGGNAWTDGKYVVVDGTDWHWSGSAWLNSRAPDSTPAPGPPAQRAPVETYQIIDANGREVKQIAENVKYTLVTHGDWDYEYHGDGYAYLNNYANGGEFDPANWLANGQGDFTVTDKKTSQDLRVEDFHGHELLTLPWAPDPTYPVPTLPDPAVGTSSTWTVGTNFGIMPGIGGNDPTIAFRGGRVDNEGRDWTTFFFSTLRPDNTLTITGPGGWTASLEIVSKTDVTDTRINVRPQLPKGHPKNGDVVAVVWS